MTKTKQTSASQIERRVMAQIKSGRVKMHSRLYYILVALQSLVIITILAVAVSYFISLSSLWLRIQTATGRAYGARQNLTELVNNFPWWAVVLAVLGLLALVFMVKRLGVLYKIRLVYIIPLIIIAALIIGFGLSYTQLPNTFKKHRQDAKICDGSTSNCTTQVRGYRFRQQ